MSGVSVDELRKVNSFPRLIELLRDKLDWPIGEDYEFEDVVFEYEPGELNLKPEERAKVREIHQLRPLVQGQPWGIFFISFEEKSISVTVLRRLLRGLVLKNRASAREATRQAWDKRDLIFAANFGKSGERELAIVHFADEKETNDLPVLKVLGWNAKDTVLHNDHIARVLSEKLRWPDDPEDHEEWRKAWDAAFETRHNEVIQTSKDLAIRLASLATDIRARANQLLKAEADDGAMRQMLQAFRKNLIQDLDEDGFADMFAQTIAYGLLAARISRPSGALVADNLTDMVPKTNPFLRELFETFLSLGGRDKRKEMDFDELGVRNVVDMLARANMEAVLRDFGDRNPKEDPVIHFYELFLKEYDPQKRMQRGVFYTPRPVVNFIVRGVDEILRTKFDLPLGLADTTTWAELAARNEKITIPDHVDPNTPFVQILDPATGTGTFLVEVIDLIHKRMKQHWQEQKWSEPEIQRRWNEYVPRHLLPRLTGFELMMAPYAIAHMKVGLKLIETEYNFGSDERAHIFLTNALEPASDSGTQKSFEALFPALAHETEAVNRRKRTQPFSIIIGNPPYSNYGQLNRGEHILDLLKTYKQGLNETKINLDDDLIKFIRLGHDLIDTIGSGILGFVTNNSFWDGITHRIMRRSLLDAFPLSYALDLHGNSKRKVGAPDGREDENVFDIMVGVGISILALIKQSDSASRMHYGEIWGRRPEKLEELSRRILADPTYWRALTPEPEFFFWTPRDIASAAEYNGYISLQTLFRAQSSGIQTKRDSVAIAETEKALSATLRCFAQLPVEELRSLYRLPPDGRDWSISSASEHARALLASPEKFKPILYRPFDVRWTVMDNRSKGFVAYPRYELMSQMENANVGIIVTRQLSSSSFQHAFVADCIIDGNTISLQTREYNYIFPMLISPGASGERIGLFDAAAQGINIDGRIFMGWAVKVSERSDETDVEVELQRALATFAYIYAILYSPDYRRRYIEFLKSDFPRIPTPGSRELFEALVPLGAELVSLHLLKPDEAPALVSPEIRFAGHGEARVERGFPQYENGKVMINATRWFEDVPKDTWEFYVGGYQVCEKWLKDRAGKGGQNPKPGRVLTDEDILHYRRVVVALTETRRIMTEIDRVIDQHGGWPGAFAKPGE